MSPPPDPPEVSAALARWPALAAFAWDRFLALGRGTVVASRSQLLGTGEEEPEINLSYVPVDWVPKGDDYGPLMKQYDPRSEVLLVITDDDGGDWLLRLRADGALRPGPEACWRGSAMSSPEP